MIYEDMWSAFPREHWGQGVVAWAGTSQVHHKDMDKVPGKNPPGTSQVHSECSQSLGQEMASTFAVFQVM